MRVQDRTATPARQHESTRRAPAHVERVAALHRRAAHCLPLYDAATVPLNVLQPTVTPLLLVTLPPVREDAQGQLLLFASEDH